MSKQKSELVVLGGGPGGYAAAFLAADLGMEVTIVEARKKLGGVCLHEGCIPSKTLLHVARVLAEIDELKSWGIESRKPEITLKKLRKRKQEILNTLAKGLDQLAKKRGVAVIQARGAFEDSETLRLENGDNPKSLKFKKCIVATGSSTMLPGPFQVDSDRVMTSREALELPDIPKSLLIVGGGYIGLEMGTVYAQLGTEVHLVEMLPDILIGVDRDLVKPLHHRLNDLFESIALGSKVTSLEPEKQQVNVKLDTVDGEKTRKVERVLVAIGRQPNTRNLGLENTDVDVDDNGFIVVDARQQTTDERILAIGDVAREPMLAHKAFHEGYVAAEIAAGQKSLFDRRAIPAVVFTDPEIAWTGVTEDEAKQQGLDVKISRYPWQASGRALSLGRTEGMTKILFDTETERVLGLGIVGVNAGEMISEGTLAIETGCLARDLADTIHPHPTLGETIGGGAAAFLGVATEIKPSKKS